MTRVALCPQCRYLPSATTANLQVLEGIVTRLELEPTRGKWALSPLAWEIETRWAGRSVKLVVTDNDDDAAIFLDEIYLQAN